MASGAEKNKWNEIKAHARKEWESFTKKGRPRILVGSATCGRACGSQDVIDAARAYLKKRNLKIPVTEVGCLGLCYAEVLLEVVDEKGVRVLYSKVTPESACRIIDGFLIKGKPEHELALAVMGDKKVEGINKFTELAMIKPQVRVALRNCGHINPKNIYHYIANDGYDGLVKALKIGCDNIIKEIKKAGLRGRGGAGFPTWKKWELCNNAEGDEKCLICNADEGDPGAFMDRALIEGDPHSVIEGMVIGAYAIGAGQGYIYARAEYPLAIEMLEAAIKQAGELGLLGDNILGSGFSFHLRIQKGAGAFVCGEETALIASIEGRRGMPRTRPPFPAQKGVFGKPTNINNVETFGNVPAILSRGSKWYSSLGTENSRGTKTFSLAGKIVRTGLIEVPMGITLHRIIYDIGGGIPGKKKFKALQTGGPSGGCLPASMLDLPVDYDTLSKAGSIMGSGGMIVMDEETCLVDIARYFLEFTYNESCGKCSPCRLGTKQLLEILKDITCGRAELSDIDLLREIGQAVKNSSLCGLGQTAPNPVLTTLKYFRDEYEAHIKRKKCPASVCKKLAQYSVIKAKCKGCMLCLKNCPEKAISGKPKEVHVIDKVKCTSCGICYDVCRYDAIKVD